MPKNSNDEVTVSAIDPRTALINEADARIIAAQTRNRELAAIRKQIDRETEANDEAIRIANMAIEAAKASLQRSSELALTEAM